MTTDCYYFQLVEVLSSSLKLKQKYINVSDRFDLHTFNFSQTAYVNSISISSS